MLKGRDAVEAILNGKDDRLMVVVGYVRNEGGSHRKFMHTCMYAGPAQFTTSMQLANMPRNFVAMRKLQHQICTS